jgi:hypothetical protein
MWFGSLQVLGVSDDYDDYYLLLLLPCSGGLRLRFACFWWMRQVAYQFVGGVELGSI